MVCQKMKVNVSKKNSYSAVTTLHPKISYAALTSPSKVFWNVFTKKVLAKLRAQIFNMPPPDQNLNARCQEDILCRLCTWWVDHPPWKCGCIASIANFYIKQMGSLSLTSSLSADILQRLDDIKKVVNKKVSDMKSFIKSWINIIQSSVPPHNKKNWQWRGEFRKCIFIKAYPSKSEYQYLRKTLCSGFLGHCREIACQWNYIYWHVCLNCT